MSFKHVVLPNLWELYDKVFTIFVKLVNHHIDPLNATGQFYGLTSYYQKLVWIWIRF